VKQVPAGKRLQGFVAENPLSHPRPGTNGSAETDLTIESRDGRLAEHRAQARLNLRATPKNSHEGHREIACEIEGKLTFRQQTNPS